MVRSIHALRHELVDEIWSFGDHAREEFDDVVSDWSRKNRPQFIVKKELRGEKLHVTVRPHSRRRASQIFAWVDQGTRPHVIKPRRRRPKSKTKKRLAFRLDYRPLTKPIARAHVGDGSSHGDWVTPKAVKHPGVKARQFSQEIGRRTMDRFLRRVESIFRRYARRWT